MTTTDMSGTRRRSGAALAAAVLVAVSGCLAGCSDGTTAVPTTPTATPAQPTPDLPQAGAGCPEDVGDGTQVRFGDDDYLAGVLLGTGSTGVVLGHENETSVCAWLPFAHELADQGYRVLPFDFAGFDASGPRPRATGSNRDDVVAAADFLRSQGVSRVVLMGASMGGTAVLGAVPKLQPGPAGVVSLSGPASFDGIMVVPSAVTAPVLYVAGEADSDGSFATDARDLARETPKGLATLLVVHGASHGTALLDGADSTTVRAAIRHFLAKNAPPTP